LNQGICIPVLFSIANTDKTEGLDFFARNAVGHIGKP